MNPVARYSAAACLIRRLQGASRGKRTDELEYRVLDSLALDLAPVRLHEAYLISRRVQPRIHEIDRE